MPPAWVFHLPPLSMAAVYQCFVMAAVLCDAFGASDVSEEGLLASFRNNRRKIQHIASQKIDNHRFDENSRIIIQSAQIV